MQGKDDDMFIHLFETCLGYYLYDVNTDMIFKIPQSVYMKLKDEKQKEDEETRHYIKKMKSEGFLKENKVKSSQHYATNLLEDLYEKHLNHLILQVTQNCNLRCSYCIYSGGYNTRTHNNKRMTWEMAKAGIDYLVSHSQLAGDLTVGFYGGEPLLEFELIKSVVGYIESEYVGRRFSYVITTNGTLLNDEIIDFLEEKQVFLTFSLDGPKEVHDKNRKFADGVTGSYEKLMENVKKVKERYPEYFRKRVSFNTVLDPQNDFTCATKHIQASEVLSDAMFSASMISDDLAKEKIEVTEKYLQDIRYERFKLYLAKLGCFSEKYVSPLCKEEFSELKRMRGGKHAVATKQLPKRSHHGGPCIPGIQRLFLSAEGTFYPCEKVCENPQLCSIGNIEKGLDIEKAKKVLNIEKYSEEKCKNCWAYRMCGVCIRCFESEEKIPVKLNEICKDTRLVIEERMKDYCVLKEVGYDFEQESLKN